MSRPAPLLAAIATLLAGGVAHAHHGPPPEAFAACKGLKDGAACSVKSPDGTTHDGTCRTGPDGTGDLACAPKDRPPGMGHHHGPPPEAFAACKGLKDGAACSVKSPDGTTHDGTCRTGPDGTGDLACAPRDMPPGMGRHHGPPPEAIEACKGLQEGAVCAVTLGGNTLDGTCRQGHDGAGPLACRPVRPPAPR